MLKFHFFACTSPVLPTPFTEEAIFTSFYVLAPLCQILIDHRDMGYVWAFCSVPLVPVSVLMPVPGCFDYSGLIIEFNIKYCDPSYFVLLSQDC